jgi:hypothetical protein
MDKSGPKATRRFRVYVVVPYHLLYLDLKLLSARLFHFSIISQRFGAIMYLLEPKGKGGGLVGAGGPLLLFNLL